MKFFFRAILIIAVLNLPVRTQAQDIYDTIRDKVYADIVSGAGSTSSLNNNVATYLSSLNATTGIWSDIDYSDVVKTNPSWEDALTRLQTMALAYTIPGTNYYQNSNLRLAINNALNYFCTRSPVPYSNNWYYQAITRPTELALIVIEMEYGIQPLDSSVKAAAINVMCQDTAVNSANRNNPLNSSNTGSNKTLVALDWIYKSLIIKNDYTLKTGVQQSFEPIQYVTGNGIRYDFSYADHTDYLYTGSYGTDMMGGIIKAAAYVTGTKYALSGSQLTFFSNWVIQSQIPAYRGRWIDWNIIGRAISRTGNVQRDFSALMRKMESIDAADSAIYESAALRMNGTQPANYNTLPRHRHYFSTDYTLHNREGYTIGIHPFSSRTKSNEILNSENLLGFWLAAGATDIQVTGDEYYNIFPLWNWTYIPGTTTPDSLFSSNYANNNQERYGTSSFVGGVSDSMYGATAMVMNNESGVLSAKKGWFLFDNEIVCIGAGITSTSNKNVNTTVNQSLLRNTAFLASVNNTVTTLNLGVNQTYNGTLNWVLQDKIGYIFPNGGNLSLIAENRQSNWLNINGAGASNSNEVENKNVFQLSFSHGVKPVGDKYAYIIVPNKNSSSDISDYIAKNDISIGINSDTVQAVGSKSLNIWQMIFYKSGAVFQNDSIKVWTNIPCVLMIKKTGSAQYKINVADPTHSYSNVTLYASLPGFDNVKTTTISLPSGHYLGQSAVGTLTNNSTDYNDINLSDIDTSIYKVTYLKPTDDAYINGNSSSVSYNYGISPTILVKYNSTTLNSNNTRYGFLKFDLSQIDTVTNGKIVNAQLKATIKSSNTSATFTSYPWSIWHIADTYDTWVEGTQNGTANSGSYTSGITWNNAYSNIASVARGNSANFMATSGSVNFGVGSTVTWNSQTNPSFLTQVENEAGGNKKFSILLFGDSASTLSDAYFYSKDQPAGSADTANIPVLIIVQKKPQATTPVEMSALTGNYDKEKASVILNWNTYSEINVYKFEILRSSDQRNYSTVGFVSAKGNSKTLLNYRYTDTITKQGVYYYLIKSIDIDGSTKTSNVIRIEATTTASNKLQVFPNPATSKINLLSPITGTGKLTNAAGNTILIFSIIANNRLTINIPKIPAGIYFISISSGNKKITQAILIK